MSTESVEDILLEIEFHDSEIREKVIEKFNKQIERFYKNLRKLETPTVEFYDTYLKKLRERLEYGRGRFHDLDGLIERLPQDLQPEHYARRDEYIAENEKLEEKVRELELERRQLGDPKADSQTNWEAIRIKVEDPKEIEKEDDAYVDQMMMIAQGEEEEGEDDEGTDEETKLQRQRQLLDEDEEDEEQDDYVLKEMEAIMGKRELINEILGKLVQKSENIKKLAKECAEVVVQQNKKLDQIGLKLDRLESATEQLKDETMRYLRTITKTKWLLVCATCIVFVCLIVCIIIGFVIISGSFGGSSNPLNLTNSTSIL